jgi:Aromatic-ring-opening dioxygenase LigAB, LigA subunit
MKIAAYMKHLTDDPNARAEFHRDAESAMKAFGLNDQERAIVASRDPAKIRAAVAKAAPAHGPLVITF